MAGSYRQINYSLRPAKTIERKLLCEAMRRLHHFHPVNQYRYVGFGSIYFSDFQLLHRSLGIDDMISLEKDDSARDCFEFNKPHNCIKVDYRRASQALPDLDWNPLTIAWLDYDGKLDIEVLSDVATVCAQAQSGSMLIVSVNAQPDFDPGEDGRKQYSEETGRDFSLDDFRLHQIRKLLGDALPAEVEGKALRGKDVAALGRRLIDARIREVLSARNATLPPEQKLGYRQTFYMIYKDGALMLTVGGLIFRHEDQSKFDRCAFNELPFCKEGDVHYLIDVPCLTMKEIGHLNAHLPLPSGEERSPPGVPQSDVAKYSELYRYFPTFAEAMF